MKDDYGDQAQPCWTPKLIGTKDICLQWYMKLAHTSL